MKDFFDRPGPTRADLFLSDKFAETLCGLGLAFEAFFYRLAGTDGCRPFAGGRETRTIGLAMNARVRDRLVRLGTVPIAEIGLRVCWATKLLNRWADRAEGGHPFLFVRQLPHAIPIRRERLAAEELAALAENGSGPVRWHHRETLREALL